VDIKVDTRTLLGGCVNLVGDVVWWVVDWNAVFKPAHPEIVSENIYIEI